MCGIISDGLVEVVFSPYLSLAEREKNLIRPGDRVRIKDSSGNSIKYVIVPEHGEVCFRVCSFGDDCVAVATEREDGMQISGFTVASLGFPLGRELCRVAEGEKYRRRCVPPGLAGIYEVCLIERDPECAM